MKRIKNSDFQKVTFTSETKITPYDLFIIFETASECNQEIFIEHYKSEKKVFDGIIAEVFYSAKTFASKVGCCKKTVDRFNRDFGQYVDKKRRYRKGRYTSNSYKMKKPFFLLMKALDRLRVFDKNKDRFQMMKWVEKLWINAGCDWVTFMNNIYNYKSPKSNALSTTCEHSVSKMSHGENPKCPTIFNSLSFISKYSTQKVPFSQKMKCEQEIERICRKSWEDYEFYASKGNIIRNPEAFFRSRIHDHSKCLRL